MASASTRFKEILPLSLTGDPDDAEMVKTGIGGEVHLDSWTMRLEGLRIDCTSVHNALLHKAGQENPPRMRRLSR